MSAGAFGQPVWCGFSANAQKRSSLAFILIVALIGISSEDLFMAALRSYPAAAPASALLSPLS